MIVNRKNTSNSRVEFVSYDGQYPNLCTGVLTVKIDGENVKFGYGDGCDYNIFWSSGGSVRHDKDWNWDIQKGEWEIDVNELPEKFWDVADELDKVINENIQYGCCGGCI